MLAKFIRGLVLILILPLVTIIFSPSSKVSAQCDAPDTQNIEVESGLISAPSLSSFKAIGSDVSCIGSNKAIIPQFAITTYDEMKTLYYDQANTSISKTPNISSQSQINLTQAGTNKLYWSPSSLTIDSEINNNDVRSSGVIFVNGDLIINKDLKNNSPTTGLAFIVKGAIKVNPSVKDINAFLISYGGFYSAWDGNSCNDTDQNFLKIYGSVISLNIEAGPKFCRQKSAPGQPAEKINYEPKYLVILKDIFARDLKIWQEVK